MTSTPHRLGAVEDGYSYQVRAVAAHGLAGSLLELPDRPMPDRDFGALHTVAQRQKLTGLLWTAATEGALPLSGEQWERARALHLRALAGTLALESRLVHTVTTLTEADIPVRVLKGAASAHLDYPDPAMRIFGDVDLLVPGPAFDEVVSLLESQGCSRNFPDPRPGFHRRFGKGACLRTPEGLELDLHRTLSDGPLGERLPTAILWEPGQCFELGGVQSTALSTEVRLLHACYHAALGDRIPQLVPLRDIAQILLMGTLDVDRFHHLVRRSRGEAVVARAVATAWRVFSLADVLAVTAWAESFSETDREARELAVYGPGSSYAARCLAATRAIPGIREKASYLAALALPQPSYLTGRHSGNGDRLLGGLREIRRIRSQS